MVKNILVFSDEIPPAGGGSGIVAKKITENYIENGFNVTLLSGDEADYNTSNLKHIRVKRITFLWVLAYGYAILRNKKINSFDIIIINDQMSAYLAGIFFTKKQLNKCTVIIHGRDSNFFFNSKSLKNSIFLFSKFYTRAITHCNKIVAVSRWTQDEYLQHLPKTINNITNKISWHFAGIDKSDLFGGIFNNDLKNSSLENKQILISVGRLVHRKGYFEMIDFFSKGIAANKNLIWLIVGDGPERNALELKVIEMGLKKSILFIGKVPRNTLSEWYLLADAFWLFSKIEPYGLVYLEAASCNLPSLGPKQGGVKEAIVENVTGFYMDENVDLNRMLNKCIELKKTKKPSTYADTISTMKFSSYLL